METNSETQHQSPLLLPEPNREVLDPPDPPDPLSSHPNYLAIKSNFEKVNLNVPSVNDLSDYLDKPELYSKLELEIMKQIRGDISCPDCKEKNCLEKPYVGSSLTKFGVKKKTFQCRKSSKRYSLNAILNSAKRSDIITALSTVEKEFENRFSVQTKHKSRSKSVSQMDSKNSEDYLTEFNELENRNTILERENEFHLQDTVRMKKTITTLTLERDELTKTVAEMQKQMSILAQQSETHTRMILLLQNELKESKKRPNMTSSESQTQDTYVLPVKKPDMRTLECQTVAQETASVPVKTTKREVETQVDIESSGSNQEDSPVKETGTKTFAEAARSYPKKYKPTPKNKITKKDFVKLEDDDLKKLFTINKEKIANPCRFKKIHIELNSRCMLKNCNDISRKQAVLKALDMLGISTAGRSKIYDVSCIGGSLAELYVAEHVYDEILDKLKNNVTIVTDFRLYEEDNKRKIDTMLRRIVPLLARQHLKSMKDVILEGIPPKIIVEIEDKVKKLVKNREEALKKSQGTKKGNNSRIQRMSEPLVVELKRETTNPIGAGCQ